MDWQHQECDWSIAGRMCSSSWGSRVVESGRQREGISSRPVAEWRCDAKQGAASNFTVSEKTGYRNPVYTNHASIEGSKEQTSSLAYISLAFFNTLSMCEMWLYYWWIHAWYLSIFVTISYLYQRGGTWTPRSHFSLSFASKISIQLHSMANYLII